MYICMWKSPLTRFRTKCSRKSRKGRHREYFTMTKLRFHGRRWKIKENSQLFRFGNIGRTKETFAIRLRKHLKNLLEISSLILPLFCERRNFRQICRRVCLNVVQRRKLSIVIPISYLQRLTGLTLTLRPNTQLNCNSSNVKFCIDGKEF